MPHLLDMFGAVRIINLVDRTDRRREATAQLARIGGVDGSHVAFFPAHRPTDAGDFPNIGTRGCFESHLSILREARDAGVSSLLIVEDDFDLVADINERGATILRALAARPWNAFYGAHAFDPAQRAALVPDESGLARVDPATGVVTAAFLAFDRPTIALLVPFLEAMLGRPAGSPDFGPMHVDGGYSVFRAQYPELVTWAALPALGHQRSSRSDITPSSLLDRFPVTRPLASLLRSARRIARG